MHTLGNACRQGDDYHRVLLQNIHLKRWYAESWTSGLGGRSTKTCCIRNSWNSRGDPFCEIINRLSVLDVAILWSPLKSRSKTSNCPRIRELAKWIRGLLNKALNWNQWHWCRLSTGWYLASTVHSMVNRPKGLRFALAKPLINSPDVCLSIFIVV